MKTFNQVFKDDFFPDQGTIERGVRQYPSDRVTQTQGKKHFKNGELAQLGERLPCTQEVSGSIPLFSTIFHDLHLTERLTYLSTLRPSVKHNS